MNKILKAFLMLICAFTLVVMTGCDKSNKKEIIVRTYDTANDCDVDNTIEIDEVTLQNVVDAYVNTYLVYATNKDEELLIGFEEALPNIVASKDGDIAVLTFSKVLENMGIQTESEFIYNLSYTITKNISNIKGIYINVNGEEYVSGHLYFELDDLIIENEN